MSRTGWGVFYHEKSLFPIEPFTSLRRPPPKRAELAPLEIRDFVYRKLIELAPATAAKEIIDEPKGLRARKILDFENYGALPQSKADRRDLAKEIRRLVNRKFPDYVSQGKFSVAGLPGFWLDESGRVQLWSDKDHSYPMMLIPYRDRQGFVQACQVRFMKRRATDDGVRYVWLSTPEKTGGLSCGSPLHFARYKTVSLNKPVLVTEGALKGETTRTLKPEFDVLASAGVACSHDEIVAATRLRSLFIAFDIDYYENPFVARAVAKLINSLSADSSQPNSSSRIKVLTWRIAIKGIDDALLHNAPLVCLSPIEWYKSLSSNCRNQINSFSPIA